MSNTVLGDAETIAVERSIKLSHQLYLAADTSTSNLASLHNRSVDRLKKLMKTDLPCNCNCEYELLLKYVLNHKAKYLIAVEYIFDDGLENTGRGDALFFDGKTFQVVEVKCVLKNNVYTSERKANVVKQATKHTKRLRLWLQYLSGMDPRLIELASCDIVSAILTDESKKLVIFDNPDDPLLRYLESRALSTDSPAPQHTKFPRVHLEQLL